MGTVQWRYTSPIPPQLFVEAMQEVLETRGWPALANAEVAKRYLDQLWERNVEDPWDEWDAQWELYDEGANGMIKYRAKLQGKLRPKEAKAQAQKEKRPRYAQGRRVTTGPRMLTAQQKADLDRQVPKTQKDMAKARARLSELRPKVTKANGIFRASKRWAPHAKNTRKIRKLPPPSKPLERVTAITGITQEGNTLHAFTVALRGEVGGTVNDVLDLDVAGSPASLSYVILLQHKGMPCKRVTGAQALVANYFYVAIQAAFVLFSMDHHEWFERPPPLRSLTMTVRDCADLLQNTTNWFSTLPVPRGSTWHREEADALQFLAAHKSSYVPLPNEVFPAVLAYRLREFASDRTQVWGHWSTKRWGGMPHGIRTGTARTLRDYTLGTGSRPSSWMTFGGEIFFFVDQPHLDFCPRQSVRPGLTSTRQFDDA